MPLCNYAYLLIRAKELDRGLKTARDCVARREAPDVAAFDKAHARHIMMLALRANAQPQQAYDLESEAYRLLTPIAERNWAMYRWIVFNVLDLGVELGRMREAGEVVASFRNVLGTDGALPEDAHFVRYFEAMRLEAEGETERAWQELLAAWQAVAPTEFACQPVGSRIWKAADAKATDTARRQALGAAPVCPAS
jgi:hypothetical protein